MARESGADGRRAAVGGHPRPGGLERGDLHRTRSPSNTDAIVKGLSGGEIVAAGRAPRRGPRQAGHSPCSVTSCAAISKLTLSERRWIARSSAVVLERLDLAAGVADDVVVVLAARVRGLVARGALADVEALDQPEAVEQLERPVDAGQADAAAALAQQVGDLARGDRAAERRDGLDHLLASRAGAVAGIGEHLVGVVGPLPGRGRQHGPEG